MNSRAVLESLPADLAVKAIGASQLYELHNLSDKELKTLWEMSPIQSYERVSGIGFKDFGDVARFRRRIVQEMEDRNLSMTNSFGSFGGQQSLAAPGHESTNSQAPAGKCSICKKPISAGEHSCPDHPKASITYV